jgi:hypothetical protein
VQACQDETYVISIENKQDDYGKIRISALTGVLETAVQGRQVEESRSILVDFKKPTNRVGETIDSYFLTGCLLDRSRPDRAWVFGKYNDVHREYLLLFWGGGHVPMPPKICAWTYDKGVLGNCQPLWKEGIYPVEPWASPACMVGDDGVPCLAFVRKTSSSFLSTTKREESYLARWVGETWKKDKVLVEADTQGKKVLVEIGEPLAVSATEGGGIAWLWRSSGDGQSKICLSLYDGHKWRTPMQIATVSPTCAYAVDSAGGDVWVAWATREREGNRISYSFVVRGVPQPVESFCVADRVRQIRLLASIGEQAHVVWASQQEFDDRHCDVYHRVLTRRGQ